MAGGPPTEVLRNLPLVDAGLTIAQVGSQAAVVLAELLELAPFTKVLFSTDAYRLPELYLAGAAQFRHSLGAVLDGWVAEGAMAGDDAERVALLVPCSARAGGSVKSRNL